ncbi:glycosyltransferase family 39 protein [bacterium]|nr:glycosyltransferase family 39 protein [bacterium]
MRSLVSDRWLWLILAGALTLRVWHLYFASGSPTFWAPAVDPLWYHEAATRAASGEFGPWPLFRAPLYPWLLGFVYALVDNDLLWARLLNLILQLATLAILYRVVHCYFGSLAARIAGALFAVNGMVIFFSAEILSTSLEMLMAVLAGWSTLALRKSPSLRQALLCGIVWGLASITRPNFLPVAPFAFAFALWPLWRPLSARIAIAGLFGLSVPIAPITLANWTMGYEPVLIATQGGVNFWIGNNPQADGIASILPGADRFWTLEEANAMAERETRRDMGPGEVSDFYYQKGQEFWLSEPVTSLKLMVRKTLLFFNRFEVSNNKHIAYFSGQTPGLSLLILLNFTLLLPLAALSLYRREARLLWGLVLAYAVSVILFFIASRFRMPIVPWLCTLAGAGVTTYLSLGRALRARAAAVALTFFIIAVINPFNAREANVGAAHYMEGNAYLALGRLDEARKSFTLAQTDPGSRELALLNLAVVEQKSNNLNQAQAILLDLLKQNSQSAPAWNNLAVVFEAKQDTASALDAYHRALHADSSHEDARTNLARLLLERGKRFLRDGDAASAQLPLKECVALIPSAPGYYHLALAFGQNAQENAAREALARALRIDPAYIPALSLLQQLEAGREAPARVSE